MERTSVSQSLNMTGNSEGGGISSGPSSLVDIGHLSDSMDESLRSHRRTRTADLHPQDSRY